MITPEMHQALIERERIMQAERELAAIPKAMRKKIRKSARALVLRDLQRRAITGEPSQFKRAPQ